MFTTEEQTNLDRQLIFALSRNHPHMDAVEVTELIKKGANANANPYGYHPLYYPLMVRSDTPTNRREVMEIL